MAKPSKKEALAAWRAAEQKYRDVLEPYLGDESVGMVDKSVAIAITKARVKADKKLDAYLHACLG